MKYSNTLPKEQETIINLDYYSRTLHVYSSKKSVMKRYYNKLGEPSKIYYIKESVSGARWKIPFADKKKMTIALSKPTLIGQMK